MATPPEDRYASASGPVNRRRAPRAPAPADNPLLKQRLQALQTRQLLGTPLSQQLLAARPVSTAGTYALLGMAPVFAATGIWMLVQAAWLPGAGTLLAGLGAGWWGLRQYRQKSPLAPALLLPVFDAEVLERLDRVMEELAPQLSAPNLQALLAIKATLLRLAPLLETSTLNANLSHDDRFYILESVRRYLPDVLQAYLGVAPQLRPVTEAGPAHDALAEQLALLHAGLQQRETLLAAATLDSMQQQQRFLESKND